MALDDLQLVDPLQELVDDLKAGGVKAAEDLERLNLPGVWVQCTTIRHETVSGPPTLLVRLWLITGDKERRKALPALEQLYRKVQAAVGRPSDDVAVASVLMTEGGRMPALMYPVEVLPE